MLDLAKDCMIRQSLSAGVPPAVLEVPPGVTPAASEVPPGVPPAASEVPPGVTPAASEVPRQRHACGVICAKRDTIVTACKRT